jgi:CDP-6-deoxy-D-xylo-4-hexulose-3-dehydrase
MKESEAILRREIYKIIRKILQLKTSKSFNPGKDIIRYAGSVYDSEEIEFMINAILDGWFGVGKYTHRFEGEIAKFLGVKKSIMTNSGSSANLLAISSLLSNNLNEEFKLKPNDEVITPALTFPTTFNPIIQNNLKPVLIDVNINTYNIQVEKLKKALSKRTRAIFIPHTLGNPNEMDALIDFAEEHCLLLLEDACDALGSRYDQRYIGSFGIFGTFSFYPAHQITTGEGGALVTNDKALWNTALSLRDWGRSCTVSICNPKYCPDKNCSKSERYEESAQSNNVLEDYDKRYTYTNIGYNLKPTEIQAAMGLAQLKKLPSFIDLRKRNFNLLYKEFEKYEDFFTLPESFPKSDPCWFAFPLTIKKGVFKRKKLVKWLTKKNIEVKLLFAGNILRHVAYQNIKCRIAHKLINSDYIMHNSFFIGLYPGMTEEKMEYMIKAFKEFINKQI